MTKRKVNDPLCFGWGQKGWTSQKHKKRKCGPRSRRWRVNVVLVFQIFILTSPGKTAQNESLENRQCCRLENHISAELQTSGDGPDAQHFQPKAFHSKLCFYGYVFLSILFGSFGSLYHFKFIFYNNERYLNSNDSHKGTTCYGHQGALFWKSLCNQYPIMLIKIA